MLADKVGRLGDYNELWKNADNHAVLESGLSLAATEWCQDLEPEERYDAILVDEGQDFRRDWWTALRAALEPAGEMMLAVDRAQNIYGVENWTDGDLRGTGLSSTWYELPVSYRMPGPLIDLTADFATTSLPASGASLPVPANCWRRPKTEPRMRAVPI